MLSLLKCYDDVAKFHEAFEAPAPKSFVGGLDDARRLLRYRLMNEEFTELIAELPSPSREIENVVWPDVVKEIIDCIVVNTGTLVELGARPSKGAQEVFYGVVANATNFLPGVEVPTIADHREQMLIINRYRNELPRWYAEGFVDDSGVVMGKEPFSTEKGYFSLMYEMFYIMLLCPLKQNVWDLAWNEVFRSNMSKLGEDGKVIRREDGKILKGPNYSPANLTFVNDYLDGTL